MKTSAKLTPVTFSPVELTLTFQTAQELNTFQAVMNHAQVCEALRRGGIEPNDIRTALETQGANLWLAWNEVKQIIDNK